MPSAPDPSHEHIRSVNARYHDVAAGIYDEKWGIDFGPTGRAQVLSKITKALGGEPGRAFGDALEIGAGTGYFSINLLGSGMILRATATDISPGMLSALRANAAAAGETVGTVACDAEQLPFEAESFDLVFGHAVLHHIPDLDRAFAEFRRVLRPGGAIVFCGEPSRHGDRLASLPKRAGGFLAPAWRRAVGARALRNGSGEDPEHELESEVDVHAFSPAQLRSMLGQAGFPAPRIRGEELIANVWGWGLRSVEASAEPGTIPMAWRRFAFRSYLALQRIDETVLEPRFPAELFYNLVLSARKA